jgi:hypothetical protein
VWSWRLIPYLLLSVLGLLVAAAVVLALSPSGPSADAVVHRAAQATLGAPSLTALSTQDAGPFGSVGGTRRILYIAPDRVIGVTLSGKVADPSSLFGLSGPQALAFLSPIRELLEINDFTVAGNAFVGSLPLADLFSGPPSEFSHDFLRVVVTVQGGYVRSINENVRLTVSGRTVVVREEFDVVKVGHRPKAAK